MKTMKTTPLNLSAFILLFAFMGAGCEKEESLDESYIILKDQQGKVFKSLKSLDAQNQPKDYNWAISTNIDYLNVQATPIDNNILAPMNLPEEYKVDGLRITISGKKYVKKNKVLTRPDFRAGFGCLFEITDIKK
jgi:hypothetical protein